VLSARDKLTKEERENVYEKIKHAPRVSNNLMVNLEGSIELRSLVTDRCQCEGNNDSGQRHTIGVLKHSQKLFKACMATTRGVSVLPTPVGQLSTAISAVVTFLTRSWLEVLYSVSTMSLGLL